METKGIKPLIIGEVGSFAHGLNTKDSDHDYIGIYADPPEALIGVKAQRGAIRDRSKPEGVKSESGDSETTYYGLRKYAQLAAESNPTIMTLMFTPNLASPDLIDLQGNRNMFLSRRITNRHIGYADSMAAQITGTRSPRTNRPELVAKHGYDTKAAFHAIRLLIQGHEMLTWQTMRMPMWELHREDLMAIRNGETPLDVTLAEIAHWRDAIVRADTTTTLPDEPNYDRINKWLIDTHAQQWETQQSHALVG